MYDRINLMIPTFKRVANGKLPKCLESFQRTASAPARICFTLLVEERDWETFDYLSFHSPQVDHQVLIAQYNKPDIGWFYNQLYERTRFNSPDTLVTLIGDDMVARTPGWDAAILEAANEMDGLGIIHCRDWIQNGKIGVNLFTTRKWVDLTGGRFMEDFPVDMIDVVYTEVARRTGRERYLDHVFIEHEHSSLKPKEEWDDGFRALRARYEEYGPDMSQRVEACIAAQVARVKAG